MPIKGLTERRRLPRIGKIHLGVKVKQEGKAEYPKAVDYFVFEPNHPQLEELVATYGEKPKALRILIPSEDEDKFAGQYYRLYSASRGLVCKGDGETADRLVDEQTGALADRNSKAVTWREVRCDGRECPDYGRQGCGEVMNLQFMLPEVSGFGVWQIDTGSVNSIMNINSALDLVRQVYGRVSMVPLVLTLEAKEVTNPDDGKKKTVRVLNLRSQDKMIEAYKKARMAPLELVAGVADEEGLVDAELPEAGKEPIFSDLPVVDHEPADLTPDDIPIIGQREHLPDGKPGDRLRVRETGTILYYHQLDKKAFAWREYPQEPVCVEPGPETETAGKARIGSTEYAAQPARTDLTPDQSVEVPPVETKAGVTTPAVSTQEGQPDGVPENLGAFFKWLTSHGRTYDPTWFYKQFSFTQEDMKEPKNLARAYAEVKQMMAW